MDRDDAKPDAKQAKASIKKASIKEAIGKLIGDPKVEAEGKAEKRTPKSDGKSGSARTS